MGSEDRTKAKANYAMWMPHGGSRQMAGAKAISSHRDAQHGADLRGQPSTVQKQEALPEGLRRERKGPYDKNVGRAEE